VEPALAYIADVGGATSEDSYKYMGQNAYCR
jgi:hypothetical protein